MSDLTPKHDLIMPVTGEADLAQDVRENMSIIDEALLTDAEKLALAGTTAVIDLDFGTYHNHKRALSADEAGKLNPGKKINNVLFDGTQDITVTADPNHHMHDAVDIHEIPTPLLQLRRIFVGTETRPDESEALAGFNPVNGDIYLRVV